MKHVSPIYTTATGTQIQRWEEEKVLEEEMHAFRHTCSNTREIFHTSGMYADLLFLVSNSTFSTELNI